MHDNPAHTTGQPEQTGPASTSPEPRSKPRQRGTPLVCRVRVVPRGLLVTDHPRNTKGLVGVVFPWVRVRVDPIVESGRVDDDVGGVMKHSGRVVQLRLRSARERQVAAAAARAALRREWRLGTLNVAVASDGPPHVYSSERPMWENILLLGSVMVLLLPGPALLLVILAFVWSHASVLSPAHMPWLVLLSVAVVAVWAALAWCTARFSGAAARRRRSALITRLTRDGLTIVHSDGRADLRPWSALRAVDPRAWPARLRFDDGAEAVLPSNARAVYIAEIACRDHLGGGAQLRDAFRQQLRRIALLVLALCLLTLPPALSGPFAGGEQGPLHIAWPIAVSLAIAAATAAAPDLTRAFTLLIWRLERLLAPSFRGRRFSRIKWVPPLGPEGPTL